MKMTIMKRMIKKIDDKEEDDKKDDNTYQLIIEQIKRMNS